MPSDYSIYCLQQDPHYRGDCTTRGYYQHPNTAFYVGGEMPLPPLPPTWEADLRYQSGGWSNGASGFTSYDQTQASPYADGKSVMFDITGDNASAIAITGEVKPAATYLMNPRDKDYVLNGTIGGEGIVVKSQQGMVTINGDLKTTGKTLVSEGVLALNGSMSGELELRAKGTLAGNAVLNYEGCRLSPGTADEPFGVMTFNQNLALTGGVYVELNLKTQDEVKNDLVTVNGDLTFSKTNTLTIVPSEDVPLAGEYVLLECTGTLTADAANIQVLGLVGLNYAVEVREKQLVLVVRGMRDPATNVQWTGVESAVWDYQTNNFAINGEPTAFVAHDEVVFPANATRRTVTLADKMVTDGVRFTHDTGTYTFNGDGGFSGTGDFVMDGKGTVVLNATKSDYTGKTVLNAGTVTVANLEKSGTESSFGAGSRIEIGKATLTINHQNAASDRRIVLTDTAAINVPSQKTTTLQNIVSGAGVLLKKGAGQLNLNYAGINSYSATILQEGILSQGAWNGSFGKSGAPITVTGNAKFIIFNNNSTSAVPTIVNAFNILKGKTLTVSGGQRCRMQGTLSGQGTMDISFPYVRGDFATDCSAFEGVLNPTSGQFRLSSTLNMIKGTLTLGGGVYVAHVKGQSGTEEKRTSQIGSLTSTATDCTLSTGVWNVGYLDKAGTYAGTFNANATVNKYGEGTWTLTGASAGPLNIYAGEVLAQNTSAPVTTGTITVQSGGLLAGKGQVQNVVVQSGGTLGAGTAGSVLAATLTVKGSLTMQAGSTLRVRTRSTATTTNADAFNVTGAVTLNSPTIEVPELNANYTYGEDVVLNVFTGTGTITINGDITMVPATPKAGYAWDTSALATEGIIRVVADPTGIRQITADNLTADDVVYDLAGHRLTVITRAGLYIVNGTKIYIKK